jgi:electron transfer flavoprotein alpha subunit
MAEVLVVVDATGGAPKKVSLELLTLARKIGEPSAVVFGQVETAKLAEYGAAKVYTVDDPEVEKYLVAPKAAVLAQLVRDKQPAAVLIASTQEGKEIAGRLAIKLDNGLLVDAVDVSEDGTATQNVFAGSVIVKSKVTKGIPLVTVRPNSVTPTPAESSVAPATEAVAAQLADTDKLATITDRIAEKKGSRPELTEASIVVSGGRGVGSAENFKLVEEMADLLGAAVGASRAATDSGFYPHTFQVGQTGKTVSPQLYVALGISGAIQHRAGMQTSKTIVAVNKDGEAPIFELADFGVVGDLFKIVPQAIEEIRKRK